MLRQLGGVGLADKRITDHMSLVNTSADLLSLKRTQAQASLIVL